MWTKSSWSRYLNTLKISREISWSFILVWHQTCQKKGIFGFQEFIKTLPALWSTYRSIKVHNFSFIPLEIDLVRQVSRALFYGWVTNRSPLLISHGCPCMIGIIKRSLVRCFCYKKHLRKPCALVFAICWFYLNELSTKQFHSYYTPLWSWLSRYLFSFKYVLELLE